MKIKHNATYFKRSDRMSTVGFIMMAAGIVLFMFGRGFLSHILGMFCIPVGLVLFIVLSSGRSTEADMDASITEQMADFLPLTEFKDPHYERKAGAILPPEVAEGYEYHEGVMLQRAKSGVMRSTEFTRALIHVYPDRLRILTRTMSFIDEKVKNEDVEILFDDIKSIAILPEQVRLPYGKGTVAPKSHRLTFTYGEGEVFATPIRDTVEADEYVDRLERILRDYRKAKAE